MPPGSGNRTRAPAHGYKAHLAAAKDSGIIRGVETTPANEANVKYRAFNYPR